MSDDTFELIEDHLILLRHANVGWNGMEFGAPTIDPKRPYGNSDVPRHMAEILGMGYGSDEEMSTITRNVLTGLHAQTETALQIVLQQFSVRPGTYVSPKYHNQWKLAEAVEEGRDYRRGYEDAMQEVYDEMRREPPRPDSDRRGPW